MNQKDLINALQQKLLETLLEDLNDSSKCSPGLYMTIRGLIADNKELLEQIPNGSIEAVEAKMAAMAPFRFTSTVKQSERF
jgi:hypothetical protein